MRRDIEIKVRLSKDEMQKLTRNVQRTHLSREGYIRTLLRGYEPQASPPEEYYRIVKYLRKLSVETQNYCNSNCESSTEIHEFLMSIASRLVTACDSLQTLYLPKKAS